MSAARLRTATTSEQARWVESIGRESARAAAVALAEPEDLAKVQATAAAIVRASLPQAAVEGVAITDRMLSAAGLATSGAQPPLPAPRDIAGAVQRAWIKARAAAPAGQRIAEAYLHAEVARIVGDALTDALRDGMAAAMAAHPEVTGWRRVSRQGCCGACLALTDGSVHPAEEPMQTHARDRCIAEPVIRGVNDRIFGHPTGQQRWKQMPEAEQNDMFYGHGGDTKADLLRTGHADLADLITVEPRSPGQRPVIRETALIDLLAANEGVTIGKPLPNAHDAEIPPGKLAGYALNETHELGGHKARVFASALGITADDADYLRDQILHALPEADVERRRVSTNRQHTSWRVTLPIRGLNGNTRLVQTTWQMRAGRPALVSAMVARRQPER